MTRGPNQFYVRPLFLQDLGCKFLLLGMTLLWLVLLLAIYANTTPPRIFGVLTMLLISIFYAVYSWGLYYDVTERRGLINPKLFISGYGVLLLLTGFIALFETVLPALLFAVSLIVIAEITRDIIRRRIPLWLNISGRINKPYRRIQRENRHQLRRYPKKDLRIDFGGLEIPQQRLNYNILLLGTVGSGKTINMRLLLQGIISRMGMTDTRLRIIMNDAKRDAMPMLRGMNPTVPIFTMNFLDARSYAWKMNADITTQAHARAVADQLAPPPNQGRDDFWGQAMSYMLEGLVYYFTLSAPDSWTFRDVIMGTRSRERLFQILNSRPETQRYAELLKEQGRLTHSVMVTIQTYLSVFAIIAALFDAAEQEGRSLSLKEFMRGEGVLLFGRDAEHLTILSAFNRLMFLRLSQIVLNREEADTKEETDALQRGWYEKPTKPSAVKATDFFIFDEFHTLGKLPETELAEFITNARSKGGSVLVAVQSLGSLIHLYGEQLTYAMLGQFVYKGILYTTDPWTQRWVSNLVGSGERYRQFVHKGWLASEWIEETTRIETVPIVPPENFARFSQPNPATNTGLTGFYMTDYGNYWHTYPSHYLSTALKSKDLLTAAFIPQDPARQHLRPWDMEDLRRLNLHRVINLNALKTHQHEENQVLAAAGRTTLAEILHQMEQAVSYAETIAHDDTDEDLYAASSGVLNDDTTNDFLDDVTSSHGDEDLELLH